MKNAFKTKSKVFFFFKEYCMYQINPFPVVRGNAFQQTVAVFSHHIVALCRIQVRILQGTLGFDKVDGCLREFITRTVDYC